MSHFRRRSLKAPAKKQQRDLIRKALSLRVPTSAPSTHVDLTNSSRSGNVASHRSTARSGLERSGGRGLRASQGPASVCGQAGNSEGDQSGLASSSALVTSVPSIPLTSSSWDSTTSPPVQSQADKTGRLPGMLSLPWQADSYGGEGYFAAEHRPKQRVIPASVVSDDHINIRLRTLNNAELARVNFLVQNELAIVDLNGPNITLRHPDLMRLRGHRWLNDELLNAGIYLINKRSTEYVAGLLEAGCSSSAMGAEGSDAADVETTDSVEVVEAGVWRVSRPRVYTFNTFFYKRLSYPQYDFHGVRRWTKRSRMDIASVDVVSIPIHLTGHWVLVVVDLRYKEFIFLDSLTAESYVYKAALGHVRHWLWDGVESTYGTAHAEALKIHSWRDVVNPAYMPRQSDPGSCGMFMLLMAEYMELGRKPDFSNNDVSNLRKRMALFLDAQELSKE